MDENFARTQKQKLLGHLFGIYDEPYSFGKLLVCLQLHSPKSFYDIDQPPPPLARWVFHQRSLPAGKGLLFAIKATKPWPLELDLAAAESYLGLQAAPVMGRSLRTPRVAWAAGGLT
jgi:hypothetical protein